MNHSSPRVLVVDNHDSYTYNLVHLIASITGQKPDVVTNDDLVVDAALDGRYTHLVISPGPGHPAAVADYGNCLRLTREARIPLLGVCLGHQGLAVAFGGRVDRIAPAHGVITHVRHDGHALFQHLPQGFRAVRYHSLAVLDVPDDLVVTARSDDGVIMGLRHRSRELHGVQFHPESVLTDHGLRLMGNFLGGGRVAPRPRRPGRVKRSTSRRGQAMVSRLDFWVEPEHLIAAAARRSTRVAWLDSSSVCDWSGRFSYLAWLEPDDLSITYDTHSRTLTRHRAGTTTVTAGVDLFATLSDWLRAEVTGPAATPFGFTGGWVGYVGYECRAITTGGPIRHSPTPDACLMRVTRYFAFDNATHAVYAVSLDPDAPARIESMRRFAVRSCGAASNLSTHVPGPAPGDSSSARPRYDKAFAQVQDELHAGNSYEVNLTYQSSLESTAAPLAVYSYLRRVNPAPYSAFLCHAGVSVLCSSPERFLKIDAGGRLETKPIKGTMPRDPCPDRDAANRRSLSTDARFRSENLMIVDLLRNDLGVVCEIDSIEVPQLMAVESYASVHQLVTTIRGRLAAGHDSVDALRAMFPPGSMTGAPKIRTTQIIETVEDSPRGVYSGVLGWLGFNGCADLAVVIRTLVHHDGTYTFGVGGGVTVQSDPDSEYAETEWKSERLLTALRMAEKTSAEDPTRAPATVGGIEAKGEA
ncbi:MAG TPA: aminodeoxychorismate synthase component I [Mycobacterium sp.]|nr:aminodeoxychorismate synthase component I [Mycobacterium sp.]